MIIESLCYFPETRGKRGDKAERSLRRVLNEFRPGLRMITAAALVMQLLPVAIPFAFHQWLPGLLDSSRWPLTQRGIVLSLLVGLFLVVAIARAVANYYFVCKAGSVGHQLVAGVRKLAHAQIMRLPVKYVERRRVGAVLLRFIGDSDALRAWFSKIGPKLLADSISLIIICGAQLYLSWRLSLVLLAPLAAFALAIAKYSAPIRKKTRDARRCQATLTGVLEQRISNIRQTKITDAQCQGGGPGHVDNLLTEAAALNANRDRSAAALEAWAQLAIFGAIPLLLMAGLPLVWEERLRAEDLIASLWLILHCVVLLRSSLGAIVVHQKALVSVQRLFALLARSAESGRGASRQKPKFCKLSVTSGGREHVFHPGFQLVPKEIDLDAVYSGLLGFEQHPSLGILLDDEPVARFDIAHRRRKIARLGDGPDEAVPSVDFAPTEVVNAKLRIVLVVAENRASAGRLLKAAGSALSHRAIVLCRLTADEPCQTQKNLTCAQASG